MIPIALLRRIARDRRGATAVEYALIAALIFVVMIAGVSQLGGSTTKLWAYVGAAIQGPLAGQ